MWLGKEKKMKEKRILTKHEETREMTILAMFIAIIAVLGLVPNGFGGTIGFIKIAPNLEATIIHIPVLIGAALLGRKFGIYLGLAFGVVSNIAAFIYASPLFIYPWVAVLPRFVFGLIIYDLTHIFVRLFKNKFLGLGISFFILTFLHTVMVLTMMLTSYTMVFEYDSISAAFVPYITILVALNVPFAAFVEMLLAAIIGSILVVRLSQYLKRDEYLSESESVEVEVGN